MILQNKSHKVKLRPKRRSARRSARRGHRYIRGVSKPMCDTPRAATYLPIWTLPRDVLDEIWDEKELPPARRKLERAARRCSLCGDKFYPVTT